MADLTLSQNSEITLWTGFVLMFLLGIGWIVAAGFYGSSCGTCTPNDAVDALVVVPVPVPGGGSPPTNRCPNGHLALCPLGSKLQPATATRAPQCITPSAVPGGAPLVSAALCPQCSDGSAPKCKAGFELRPTTRESGGVPGFQCVSKVAPFVVMKPMCSSESGASQ